MPGSKVFSGCDIQRQSSDITALCCYSHFDLCIFREKSAPFSAGFTAKLIPRKFKLGGSISMKIETGALVWCVSVQERRFGRSPWPWRHARKQSEEAGSNRRMMPITVAGTDLEAREELVLRVPHAWRRRRWRRRRESRGKAGC